MNEELKSCPYCDGEPKSKFESSDIASIVPPVIAHQYKLTICCAKCGASITSIKTATNKEFSLLDMFELIEDATNKWNARVNV